MHRAEADAPLAVAAADEVAAASTATAPATTFTLAACTLLTLALTAKTIHSTIGARHARHDARAWRRVSMALLERRHGTRHAREGAPRSSWTDVGPSPTRQAPACSAGPAAVAASATRPTTMPAANPTPPPYTHNPLPASQTTTHPHEDWDWVPADYPRRPRQSWKHFRMPTHRQTGSKADADDGNLWLLRSALWPEADALQPSESTFIAGEAVEDASSERQGSATVHGGSESAMRATTDRVEALERQVWALLARAKALEERRGPL